jgi:hypothetical protein
MPSFNRSMCCSAAMCRPQCWQRPSRRVCSKSVIGHTPEQCRSASGGFDPNAMHSKTLGGYRLIPLTSATLGERSQKRPAPTKQVRVAYQGYRCRSGLIGGCPRSSRIGVGQRCFERKLISTPIVPATLHLVAIRSANARSRACDVCRLLKISGNGRALCKFLKEMANGNAISQF